MDERVLGGIEVSESSTLADARAAIAEDEILGVPSSYLFLFGGAPVSRRQECRRRAVDCFPFLLIIPEDARVQPVLSPQPSEERHTILSSEANAYAGASRQASSENDAPTAYASPSITGSLMNHSDRNSILNTSFTGPDVESELAEGDVTVQPNAESEDIGSMLGNTALELQITDGPLEGTTVTVGEEGARIGRHTSNALVIPEAGISKWHCEICYRDGEFCVRDVGSTTGTYFYLRPHGRLQMFSGLMVKLGEFTEFQVLSQSPSDSENPEQVVLFYWGPLAGHKVHIPASGITIGRRHNNNLVVVQDGTVSAHHAVIYHEEGEFFLSDLGSCNGTCIRLSTERTDSDWHPIMDGDMIGAGCTKIQCRVLR